MHSIYLFMPYSYSIEPDSKDALSMAPNGWEDMCQELGDLRLQISCVKSSMLCESFNHGIAVAKNGKFDECAMLHSDMVADQGWLCRMALARKECGADILNAVAMIKDERGLTNNAIAYDTDWRSRKRRLTIKECAGLPDIFTIEDIRRVIDPNALMLLPNPGCLIMGMGEWFYKWPGFYTESYIEDLGHGVFQAREISEDWLLGYYAHEHGIKVAATTRIKTDHIGKKKYSTRQPYGIDVDREYFQSIGQPYVGPGRWVFPGEVDGWLTSIEGVGLARLADGKRVLEIGSYRGRSTICMAQTAKEVVAVDPHDGRATDQPGPTLQPMLSNLGRYQCTNVTIQQCTSEQFFADYEGERFDFVFIDGNHSYDCVKRDAEIAVSLLTDGGLIAFHDYRLYPSEHDGRWDPEVTKAVNDWMKETGSTLVQRHGSVGVVALPAGVLAG